VHLLEKMTDNEKLKSLAFRLQDLESLRRLFAELNYEFADEPVYTKDWNQSLKDIVIESRIVAKKNDFLIYYIKTESDSVKEWKSIATKIITSNNGFCLVCTHNPAGFQWVFSGLSKEYSKSFSESRHFPIEIKPNLGVPQPFLEFLELIQVNDSEKGITILKKISNAFDNFAFQIHDELTVNVFEAFKTLSTGIIKDKSNNLSLSDETLEEIRESIFILLYRIIFVLYAEDRSIFPIENKEKNIYLNKFSLKWLKHNWILNSNNLDQLREYEVQNRLKQLFRLIEVGSEGLDYDPNEFFMRSYYGRLFDRKLNPQLEKWNIPNQFYLRAIEFLTSTIDAKGNRFFLDYGALEVRHLGSIYEHLIEFHLTIKDEKILELPNPKDRKSSGSYYTPEWLVDYIVKNSIEPLIEKIIKENPEASIQVEKILSLKILDPAMGSGHFLVGATEYIAKRICEIEGKENSVQYYNEKKRDVVRKCIYGVDVNPLAVDLAKLSLWLETLSSDRPLSFLSAHLKNGNSLMGESVDKIFHPQQTIEESRKKSHFKKAVTDFLGFESLEDDTSSAVKAKIEKYEKMRSKGSDYHSLCGLLDHCIAPFFGINVQPLGDLRRKIGVESLDFYSSFDSGPSVYELRKKHNFFHWEIEFPEIFFTEKGERKTDTGFDIIIGNPPWERLTIQDREFFHIKDPNIANASNSAIRKKMIKNLEKVNPRLYAEYLESREISDLQTKYLKDCGKFPFGAVGDINLYPVFLELFRTLVNKNGRCGLILPTGIITDYTYQKFFENLVFTSSIVICHDFTNKQKIFKDIGEVLRFSILILKSPSNDNSNFSLSVLNKSIDDVVEDRIYSLTRDDLKLFNPNTKTCPLFPSKKDFEVCKKIYEKNPILINESEYPVNNTLLMNDTKLLENNPWKIEYWRMYDMSNDSGLFHKKEELISKGFTLKKDNEFVKNKTKYIQLYEAKLFTNYNHRHGSFENIPIERRFGVKAEPNHPTIDQKKDTMYEIEPRYWVEQKHVQERCKRKNVKDEPLFSFRNICRTFNDTRTVKGTIIPFSAVGHSAAVLIFRDKDSKKQNKNRILFSCVFSSMVFDYIVRQKLSGANLSKYILIQIPAPAPESFKKLKLTYGKVTKSAEDWCIEKCSNIMPVTQKLAKAFRNFGILKPIKWDENNRVETICFIDAVVAHTYELNKRDYEYILNQFPILRRQEEEKFGKFVSLEKCLEFFDSLNVLHSQ